MDMTATRPDLMYCVCLISLISLNPMKSHMHAAERILRYVKATAEFGGFYKRGCEDESLAYADSDYTEDLNDQKK